MMVDQNDVKEFLSYEPSTGVFIWVKGYRNRNVGKIAGFIDYEGYRQITFKGRIWRAHHLAWLYMFGSLPASSIDHIDGDRSNNSIANLREVTFAGNSQNQRIAHKDSKFGKLGVDKLTHRKLFRARIQCEGKRITLGYFKTPEEAHQTYLMAKRAFHETCTI